MLLEDYAVPLHIMREKVAKGISEYGSYPSLFLFLFSHLDISSFIEAIKLIQKFKHSTLNFSRAACKRKQKEV